MKNVIITSGGTREKIDEARVISNLSTGKLGSLIADEFMNCGFVKNVFYICGKNSFKPQNKFIKIFEIENVENLKSTIDKLVKEISVDVFVHSMAVSDYKISSVISIDDLSKCIFENINKISNENVLKEIIFEIFQNENLISDSKKISSRLINPIMLLNNNLKIISTLRNKIPKAKIIGFKLLSNICEQELLNVAYNLLVKNNCDYVLANDSSCITEFKHKGYLIDKNKNFKIFETKKEIAKGIVDEVLKGDF